MGFPTAASLIRRVSIVIALVFIAAVGCGPGDPPGTADPNDDTEDSPCPCDGDAECEDDICVAPLGGECGGSDYVCGDDLVCAGTVCRGDEGHECDAHDDCRDGYSCLEGTCQDVCPCDGEAECVEHEGYSTCVSPIGSKCDAPGYECDDNLLCRDAECVGDEGAGCEEDDDCDGELSCVDDVCEFETGPCPCDADEDAECVDDDGTEFCEVPAGGLCDEPGYECEEGLLCIDGTCGAEEWGECQEDDHCIDDLECIGGLCAEDECGASTSCPADGDSGTVDQPYCDKFGDGCVQCRHWADESTGSGAADCPDDQVCTELGYCADPIHVPRLFPLGDSDAEAEAVAIAAAVCSLDTDDEKVGGQGSANALCGTVVMEDASQELTESDVRDPAESGDFSYLEDEDTIDGYDGDVVASEIESVWDESLTGIDRLSWFSEGDMSTIPQDSRYEICIWMGSDGPPIGGPWRIGIDTCQAYYDRGYVDDWNEDG